MWFVGELGQFFSVRDLYRFVRPVCASWRRPMPMRRLVLDVPLRVEKLRAIVCTAVVRELTVSVFLDEPALFDVLAELPRLRRLELSGHIRLVKFALPCDQLEILLAKHTRFTCMRSSLRRLRELSCSAHAFPSLRTLTRYKQLAPLSCTHTRREPFRDLLELTDKKLVAEFVVDMRPAVCVDCLRSVGPNTKLTLRTFFSSLAPLTVALATKIGVKCSWLCGLELGESNFHQDFSDAFAWLAANAPLTKIVLSTDCLPQEVGRCSVAWPHLARLTVWGPWAIVVLSRCFATCPALQDLDVRDVRELCEARGEAALFYPALSRLCLSSAPPLLCRSNDVNFEVRVCSPRKAVCFPSAKKLRLEFNAAVSLQTVVSWVRAQGTDPEVTTMTLIAPDTLQERRLFRLPSVRLPRLTLCTAAVYRMLREARCVENTEVLRVY